MSIDVTNYELNTLVLPSLVDLSKVKLPVKAAFQIRTILSTLQPLAQAYEESRLESIKNHAKKNEDGEVVPDENGNVEVPEENREAAAKEIQELLECEVKCDVEPLTLDSLGDIEVEAEILLKLGDFLTQ